MMGTITTITGSASIFPERTDTNIRLHIQNTPDPENSLCIANLIASDIKHINWLPYSNTTNLALRSIPDDTISLLMPQIFHQQIQNISLRSITSSAITLFTSHWMEQLQGLQLSALDLTAILTMQQHSFPNLKKLVLHDLDANAVSALDLQKFPQVTTIKLSLTGGSLTLVLDKLKALPFTGKVVAGNNLSDEEKQKINDFNEKTSQAKLSREIKTPGILHKRLGEPLFTGSTKKRNKVSEQPSNPTTAQAYQYHFATQQGSLLYALQQQEEAKQDCPSEPTNTEVLAVGFRPQ